MRRLRPLLLGVLALAACAPPRPPGPAPAAAPRIVDWPISFSQQRVDLTRDYIREHYGVDAPDITIVPRIVVLHWTAVPTLQGSWNVFDQETLQGSRPDLAAAGQVNVAIQFLVDRDGTIYRLMPETWMARHVIGLNYNAIGVENVGGSGDRAEDLTEAQVAANIALVRYLAEKYPSIEYLIGHQEYREFEGHPLWLEKDPSYRTGKRDPGEGFMAAVRAGVAGLRLKGVPEIEREKRAAALLPGIIPHAAWEAHRPLGLAADADRRNLPVGGALRFHDLGIAVRAMQADSGEAPRDRAVLELERGGTSESRTVAEGSAFSWGGYHVAVLAVHPREDELGGGLTELEVATVASLPPELAAATEAGGPERRLRVPQTIHAITLHHEGSAQPVLPGSDVVGHLRALQSWGERDKDWWDVPYHFLIGPEGEVYQGRDWHYMGETNTEYDPRGNLLISVLGNYDQQQPTPAQLQSITRLMAWAAARFDVPLDSIRGHGDLAQTGCPGTNLRSRLADGTFREGVRSLLREAGLR